MKNTTELKEKKKELIEEFKNNINKLISRQAQFGKPVVDLEDVFSFDSAGKEYVTARVKVTSGLFVIYPSITSNIGINLASVTVIENVGTRFDFDFNLTAALKEWQADSMQEALAAIDKELQKKGEVSK